jgi:hypothetical protein
MNRDRIQNPQLFTVAEILTRENIFASQRPEAHPASHPMDTVGPSPGVKRSEHESNISTLSSSEVKNGGNIPPLPPASCWGCS